MKILVIDNYDSFTYNLVQQLGSLNCEVVIKRNDEIDFQDINNIKPDKILISPGPGRPEDSKVSLDLIKYYGSEIPILGVCLGHQAIAVGFGGKVVKAPIPKHGKTSIIKHNNSSVFKNLPQNFDAMRYHSLTVERKSLPSVLSITAESDDASIMGLKHIYYPITGIQFHPESILTAEGKSIIKNWLNE
jgi:anthranilate synthase/aminodeoxychorismate synthase-like glutamine amidotransferase